MGLGTIRRYGCVPMDRRKSVSQRGVPAIGICRAANGGTECRLPVGLSRINESRAIECAAFRQTGPTPGGAEREADSTVDSDYIQTT